MVALQGFTAASLTRAVPAVSLLEARKVVAAIHRHDDLSLPVRQVRRASLEAVRRAGDVPTLDLVGRHASQLDPFVKLSLRTADGLVVESVRIPLEQPGRFTACISSQAGCALACSFCATGALGLQRNLATWEIVEQVRMVRHDLGAPRTDAPAAKRRVHGVVFQGMGEPLANLDRVLEAIAVFTAPEALAIDARNITVCTAGLPVGILALAEAAPKVRLAVSVHAVRPEVRCQLMPIEKAHPLVDVVEACAEHVARTGLAPMWVVTLLAGVNDSLGDADALAAMAHAFEARTGKRPRLSVVAYNDHAAPSAMGLRRTSDEHEAAFRARIGAQGLPVHRRYSGGGDVGAACGQLAGRHLDATRRSRPGWRSGSPPQDGPATS